MRMLIAIAAAAVVVSAVDVHAQAMPQPQNCGYYVEIQNGKITAFSQQGPKCNHQGKWRLAVNNLDDEDYDLWLDEFKYLEKDNPNDDCMPASEIKMNGASTRPPFRNQSANYVKIRVDDDDITKDKREIPKKGDVYTACYAFDIKLKNTSGSVTFDVKDPDLEIAEPGNLPPPVKPERF